MTHAKTKAPKAPSYTDLRDAQADGGAQMVETLNGRCIVYYPGSNRNRPIYAVGGVGFYHLDEARLYAKGKADDNA